MVSLLVMEEKKEYTSQVNKDNLWKKVIGELFDEFLLFFLPELHEQVDFTKPIESLDKDLHKIIIDKMKRMKRADHLLKVHLKNGCEQWILVHIEIQDKDEKDFAKRMFQYYYRIFDQYEKNVVAIALFTNTSSKSTNEFNYEFSGTKLTYTYNKYTLTDFDEELLKNSNKLFSKALLAGYYYNKTKKNAMKRYEFKEYILKEIAMLENVTYQEQKALLYFVDFLLALPNSLTRKLSLQIEQYFGEEKLDMIHFNKEEVPPTFGELKRMEREEGREQGIEKGRKEEKLAIAKKLLELSMPIEQIAEVTGLTLDQVQSLIKEI